MSLKSFQAEPNWYCQIWDLNLIQDLRLMLLFHSGHCVSICYTWHACIQMFKSKREREKFLNNSISLGALFLIFMLEQTIRHNGCHLAVQQTVQWGIFQQQTHPSPFYLHIQLLRKRQMNNSKKLVNKFSVKKNTNRKLSMCDDMFHQHSH